VADKSRTFPWTQAIAAVAIAIAAAVLAGLAIGFSHSFKALGASDRARFIAKAIAEAFNCAVLFAIVAIPCALAIVLIRARRSRET
jgi:biopolymer transport protein ExbB/TolQ